MNCRNCQYPLWGIAARQCPECGAGFVPSEFRYRRGGVKFCCPHCDQAYVGTDEDGLPEPRGFECVSCARAITLDEMTVRPRREGKAQKPPLNENPWTQRRRLGFGRGMRLTAYLGAVRPAELLRVTRPGESAGISFLVCFLLLCSLLCMLPMFALVVAGSATSLTRFNLRGMVGPLGVITLFCVGLAAVPCVIAAIMALVGHLVLAASGPLTYGLRRTIQAIAFSAGPMTGCMLPCVGIYWFPVGLVWWGITAGLALSQAHRVSALRATAAILAGVLVLLSPLLAYAIATSAAGDWVEVIQRLI